MTEHNASDSAAASRTSGSDAGGGRPEGRGSAPSGSSPVLNPAEAAARQRAFIVGIVRAAYFIIIMTFTMLWVLGAAGETGSQGESPRWYPVLAGLALFGMALGIDLLTPKKKIATITGVLIGSLAGILATLAVGLVIDLVLTSWLPSQRAFDDIKPIVTGFKILIGMSFIYLGVTTVLQTQDDFRLVIPYVEFAKQIRGQRPILIDTSTLIDARIIDIGGTGILQAPLIIPAFVINELHQLADSAAQLKRARGRRGLDVIAKLQRSPLLDVSIDETFVPGKAVDQMLVELAKQMSAVVMTNDVALARVAALQQVPIINIHELANAVKPSFVPGESLTIKLLRQGEQHDQAVGFLDDGTMVVAEDAVSMVGQTVTLTVTSSLQTNAGRLIFGRLGEQKPSGARSVGESGITELPPSLKRGYSGPKASEVRDGSESSGNVTGGGQGGVDPAAGETGPNDPADQPGDPNEDDRARTPFPPKPPRSIRGGTPRNPRR